MEFQSSPLKFPASQILVFAKAPVENEVKTRLIPDIGAKHATALYQSMLEQTVATATVGNLCKVSLYCTPNIDHPIFKKLSQTYPVQLMTQQGNDLGERMFQAASQALKTSYSVVIIGTDCLQLTESLLGQVLALLANKTSDVVITPAHDGGYVLLGLNQIHRDLFTDIEWGTDRVMEQTRNALNQLEWNWQLTPMLRDIDTVEDVRYIYQNGHQYPLSTGVRDLLHSIFK